MSNSLRQQLEEIINSHDFHYEGGETNPHEMKSGITAILNVFEENLTKLPLHHFQIPKDVNSVVPFYYDTRDIFKLITEAKKHE